MITTFAKNSFLCLGLSLELICALILFANTWVPFRSQALLVDEIQEFPCHSIGLVLGASPMLGDRPNYFFRYRMDAAAELYHAGKVRHFIASGDNHAKSYDEPSAMRDALIKRGVPTSAISLDYAGFRTLDSIVRAQKVFGQDRLLVISQRFHNERAIFIGRHYGMEIQGWNAKDLSPRAGFKTHLREYPARVKALLDVRCYTCGDLFQTQTRWLS
ncbi:MAG: ElyC/SanA/YdcF family protein [Bacteroidota bacterium]